MKKMYFSVLLAAMAGINVQAQVFQYLHGTSANDLLTDGHNTTSGGTAGHFLVAPLANTRYAFSATHTNNAGSAIPAGSPYFSNQYRLSDVPIPSGAPNLQVHEVRSVEQLTGNSYGIAGSYSGGASATTAMGVFYQMLGPKGNLVAGTATGYFVGGTSGVYSDIHVSKIINSTLVPGDMYILGTIKTTGGYNRIFVLRINANGTLVWSRIYYSSLTNSDIPYDIVESRQMRGTTYELVVVGNHYAIPGGLSDGFLLRINYANGNMINPIQFYGSLNTDEGFSCIKTSSNNIIDPTGAGYVIGGHSDNLSFSVSNVDYWFVALDQSGGVTWSNTFDYNNGTGISPNDYCNDLIEYNRAPGMYEYYLAGYTQKGVLDFEDAMVIHTDQTGNIIPGGQFTYGAFNNQRCQRIDLDNNPASGGITLYGSAQYGSVSPPLGAYDLYMVKAGFSGNTSCDYDLRDGNQNSGPGFYFSRSSDFTGFFNSYTMYTRPIGILDEFDVCSGSGSCTSPKPPLVAHWNFTGGSLADPVNGLTGVIHGGVTPAAGILGTANTAYQFDGATGYIQVPSNPVMDLQSWTLTAVVQPQGFYNGTCQANSIVWRGNQYGTDGYGMLIYDNGTDNSCSIFTPSGELAAGFAAGSYPGAQTDWQGAIPCVTNPCINLGQWYCIWLSYDALSGNMDVYVDGIYRVTLNWPNQYGPPAVNDLFIGSSNLLSTFPYYFNGVIDDIAIFAGPLVCPLDCTDAYNGLAKNTQLNAEVVSGNDITALPNPTTGSVELNTSDGWKNGTVTVLNAIGQEVTHQQIDPSGKTMIDLSAMPAGIYLLRTQVKGQYTVKKVIKN